MAATGLRLKCRVNSKGSGYGLEPYLETDKVIKGRLSVIAWGHMSWHAFTSRDPEDKQVEMKEKWSLKGRRVLWWAIEGAQVPAEML